MSTMLLCVGKYWLCVRKMGCFDFEASNFIAMRRTFYAFCSFPTRFTPHTIDDPLTLCWFCMLLFTYRNILKINWHTENRLESYERQFLFFFICNHRNSEPRFSISTSLNIYCFERTSKNGDVVAVYRSVEEILFFVFISAVGLATVWCESSSAWKWANSTDFITFNILLGFWAVEMDFSSESLQLNAFNRKVLRSRRGQTPTSNGTQFFLHRSIDESHSLYLHLFITWWNSIPSFT